MLSVTSVGINNLPAPVRAGLAELFGAIPELLDDCLHTLPLEGRPDSVDTDFQQRAPALRGIISQAQQLGYANIFDAIHADRPWRPLLANGSGTRLNPRPTAPGSQSAIVIGAHGEATPPWCR